MYMIIVEIWPTILNIIIIYTSSLYLHIYVCTCMCIGAYACAVCNYNNKMMYNTLLLIILSLYTCVCLGSVLGMG